MRETSKTYDRFRYDITNAHLYGDMALYRRTLESSEPSPAQFSLHMSSKSPTGGNSPSFYVLFTQDELYSWVDIRMEVSSIRRNEDVSIFDITETISLLKKPHHNLESLGSIHNLMIIQMDTSKEDDDQVNIMVQMNSSYESRSPLLFYRELIWSSHITLNKLGARYMVRLSGHPQNATIANYGNTWSVLNILWMGTSHKKYRFNHYTEYCSMKIRCKDIFYNIPGIFTIPGIFYGLVFQLQSGTISTDILCEICSTRSLTDGLSECPERNSTPVHKARFLRIPLTSYLAGHGNRVSLNLISQIKISMCADYTNIYQY